MTATLNTFPPFHAMNSPRGWILALIILLHFGFFVLLSSGMAVRIVDALRAPPVLVVPPPESKPMPPEEPRPIPVDIKPIDRVFVPEPTLPRSDTETQQPMADTTSERLATSDLNGTQEMQQTVVTEPNIDPRIGLSEPPYPAAAIRAGQTGVVLLSIYVLENGRVGDVRLDQSSGFLRLDDSAMREARRWRLQPGMRDGVPVAMWKQIPVTFRLQSSGSTRF